MLQVKPEHLVELAKYLTPLHHSHGRLRVRVSQKIKEMKNKIDTSAISLDSIKNIQNTIKGIKDVKVIPLMGSITILYDDKVFPMQLWEDLLNGKNVEETTKLLNKLAKEFA